MAGKAEIVNAIADGTGISKRDAAMAFDAFLNSVTSSLRRGERVFIPGLGSFTVTERKARDGRNPSTGETIKIPAMRAVKFRAGKEVKELVNRKPRK
jgi:DNA-binding protein HU-beta